MINKLAFVVFASTLVSGTISAVFVYKTLEKDHNERVEALTEMHAKVIHRLAAYVPVEVLRDALTEVEFDGIVKDLKEE